MGSSRNGRTQVKVWVDDDALAVLKWEAKFTGVALGRRIGDLAVDHAVEVYMQYNMRRFTEPSNDKEEAPDAVEHPDGRR